MKLSSMMYMGATLPAGRLWLVISDQGYGRRLCMAIWFSGTRLCVVPWALAGAGLWSGYPSLLPCHGSHQVSVLVGSWLKPLPCSALEWKVLAQIS